MYRDWRRFPAARSCHRCRGGMAHRIRCPQPARSARGVDRAARNGTYRDHAIHAYRAAGTSASRACHSARDDRRRHLRGREPVGVVDDSKPAVARISAFDLPPFGIAHGGTAGMFGRLFCPSGGTRAWRDAECPFLGKRHPVGHCAYLASVDRLLTAAGTLPHGPDAPLDGLRYQISDVECRLAVKAIRAAPMVMIRKMKSLTKSSKA